MMFGSDYPILPYDRQFKEFEDEGCPPEILQKSILQKRHQNFNPGHG
jgi:hypothetical protein